MMVNAAGQTNGCEAKVKLLFDHNNGVGGVKIAQYVTCPADAGALRVRYNWSMYEVSSDGTETLFNDANPGSLGGVGKATSFMPCAHPGVGGTHTWLIRARMHTKTSEADTNPYVGVVAVQATITCPV